MPKYGFAAVALALAMAAVAGCESAAGNYALAGGIAGTALLLGQAPGNELEQVYYLGVLDPQEQVPSSVYRVTVRGQSSALSRMRFASGWVNASVIDSLEGSVKIGTTQQDGAVTVGNPTGTGNVGGEAKFSEVQTGRRLVMFGPEGFREAPKGHRLVIVMGANPDAFFGSVDKALANVTTAQVERLDAKTSNAVLDEMTKLREEQLKVSKVETLAAMEFGKETP